YRAASRAGTAGVRSNDAAMRDRHTAGRCEAGGGAMSVSQQEHDYTELVHSLIDLSERHADGHKHIDGLQKQAAQRGVIVRKTSYPSLEEAVDDGSSRSRDKLTPDWQTAEHNFWDMMCALEAVSLVRAFLWRDPALKARIEPLTKLVNALLDLRFGGKPKLFFRIQYLKGGGKPVWDTGAMVQGYLAAVADLLIRAGMTREQAKSHLAKRITDTGIRDEAGKLVSAARVLQCRDHYRAQGGADGARF